MTLYELWQISPRTHVFVQNEDGTTEEYIGEQQKAYSMVANVFARNYPSYGAVIEVKLCGSKTA